MICLSNHSIYYQEDIERIPNIKIFDNDGFSIRVKSKGKNRIKLLIKKN